jgi:hypothetical protein
MIRTFNSENRIKLRIRDNTITCHGTFSRYDSDISQRLSASVIRIVSVYESHQSAISQQLYSASYQDPIQV